MATDWIKRPLPDLDLYLAHAFKPYPAVWAQLVARGADRDVTDHAFWRIHGARVPMTLDGHTKAFGPPAERRDDSYLWPLTLWPDHQLLVAFFDDRPDWDIGKACQIVRRVPGRPERVSPLSIDATRRALRLGYDTTAEAQASLGDCDRYDGWWPWDSWEYDVPDGSVLHCIFSLGILVDITSERLHDPISRRTHPSPTDPTSS